RAHPSRERMEHLTAVGVGGSDERGLDEGQLHGRASRACTAGRGARLRSSILGGAESGGFSGGGHVEERVGGVLPAPSGTPTQHFITRATSKLSSSMWEWM